MSTTRAHEPRLPAAHARSTARSPRSARSCPRLREARRVALARGGLLGEAAVPISATTPAPRAQTVSYSVRATIPRATTESPPVAAGLATAPRMPASPDAMELPDNRIDLAAITPFVDNPPAPSTPATSSEPGAASAPETAEAVPPAGGDEAAQPISLPDIEIPGLAELGSADAIIAGIGYSGAISQGGVTIGAADFGITSWGDLKLSGITVTPAPAVSTFVVAAQADHTIRWDVRSGTGPNSQKDIASATDSDITQANYPTVVSDLTPNMSSNNGRPPRTKFWAQDLTEKHEKFHASDVKSFGPAAVVTANTWLGTQTAADVAGVNTLLTQVPARVVAALVATYAAGNKDEDRAYGDGASSYTTRATAVNTMGSKSLYP